MGNSGTKQKDREKDDNELDDVGDNILKTEGENGVSNSGQKLVADIKNNAPVDKSNMWDVIKQGLADKSPQNSRNKPTSKTRHEKRQNVTYPRIIVASKPFIYRRGIGQRDEFFENVESKVKAFFKNCVRKEYWLDYMEDYSLIYVIPELYGVYRRHQALRKHSCFKHQQPLVLFENDKASQTDFKRETWIHKQTTVKPGNTCVNVVSATIEQEQLLIQKRMAKRINNQITVIRCAVYNVLGKIGFAEFLKNKLKTVCPDASDSYGKKKIMDVCRERIEWYTNQFIENFGPLPLDELKFSKIIDDFVALIESSFKDKLSNANEYFSRIETEHKTMPVSNSESQAPSEENMMEAQCDETNIEVDLEDKLSSWEDSESESSSTDSSSSDDDDNWHDVEGQGDGLKTNMLDPSSDDSVSSDTETRKIKKHRTPTNNVISNARMFRELLESPDAGQIGSFDCGTYRADGEVLVQKCKRGSMKRIEVKPKKVKTRGVPNKHLRQPSEMVEIVNSGFGDSRAESQDLIGEKKVQFKDHVNPIEVDASETSFEHYKPTDRIIISDDEVNESTADQRHLMEQPSQVIQGKKNDCDLLEEKYSAKQNKKRQKDERKKRQRARSNLTTIQFGLNANNCADDPDLWSTDDEDVEYVPPRVTFSSVPIQE